MVTEDDRGLSFDVDLNPDDTMAAQVYARVARGDVYGSSVRFRVLEFEEKHRKSDEDKDVYEYRILKADLRELGPVVEPVYEASTAATRSRQERAALTYVDFLRAVRMPEEMR